MPNIIKEIHLLFIILVMSPMITCAKSAASMSTVGCNVCTCFSKNGVLTAECNSRHFSTIPSGLTDEIRSINLTDNMLSVIPPAAFASVNLQYLHKISLKKCHISRIDEDAFLNLTNLIELDLSDNEIVVLTGSMFRYSKRLRRFYCKNNQVEVIDKHFFKDFVHLQVIELSVNKIHTINAEAFRNVGVLYLNIDGNRLKFLDIRLLQSMAKLKSVDLTDNPWLCDCNLRELRDYVLDNRLCTLKIFCDQPLRLRRKVWSNLDSDEFACRPQIVQPQLENIYRVSDSSNYTLNCKVSGDPEPTVDWYFKHLIIEKEPSRHFTQQYGLVGHDYWNNLTIVDLKFSDRGEYKCIAKNFAGIDERNFLLQISENAGSSTLVFGGNDNFEKWSIIFAVVVIILTIFLILVLLIFCLFRKYRSLKYDKKTVNDRLVTNGDLSVNSTTRLSDDVEKSLITNSVNPVMKPPRQQQYILASTPVTNNNLEHSDVLNKLLDSDSMSKIQLEFLKKIANTDDNKTLIYNETASTTLQSEFQGSPNKLKNNRPYPPDLLAFPSQISPTGSSASTVLLSSLHQKPSPNHFSSTNNSLYRTLPHPRSQSPFIGLPVCIPKTAGYVTIPRRPRASWSCAPSQTMVPLISEPVYDNLGLRTTATGSSVLSLNKSLERPNLKPKLIMSPGSLIPNHSPQVSSIEMNGFTGKSVKIPPRPPPKPKKLIHTGPLFEDEGEDGTEV